MESEELTRRFAELTTAHLADACVRVGVTVRCAPTAVQGVTAGDRLVGRVLPARHAGSVDVFLEAMHDAEPGDVLVVDDGGRADASCVGDLLVLEASGAGLAGVVVWGLHRDTADLRAIGLPVFSMGSIPSAPLRPGVRPPDALESATVGEWLVGAEDLVAGDDDGVLFVPLARAEEVFSAAERIRDTERGQADRMRGGTSLREQVRFGDYLTERARNPELTFREHLRAVSGAIE